MELSDILTEIRLRLQANSELVELMGTRISAYQYAETADHEKLFVVLVPLAPPRPEIAGSNKPLSVSFSIQINVEGKNRIEVKKAQHLISQEMSAFNFAQMPGGVDEYFPETERFADVRRYSGSSKIYKTDY